MLYILFLTKRENGEGNSDGFSLFQRSEAAPVEESDPPLSAPINIKDEPIDEGYDAALLPQNSIKQIKEELEHQEVCIERIHLLFLFWHPHKSKENEFLCLLGGAKD